MLRVLDLFSGIGGFSLGLERTGGFKTVAFCEIDPYCRAVLRKHWPYVPIHEDVTKLTAADVGDIDVICGGFPCQDVSNAGAKAGIEGERSGLWKEQSRLIRELRPDYAIVENVSALLDGGIGVVLGDLAEIGYDAEWHCFPAASLGAPHIRARVWIIAYPGRKPWTQPIFTTDHVQEGSRRCERQWRKNRQFPQVGSVRPEVLQAWLDKSKNARMVDGLQDWPYRARAIGNAVLPQIPEIIGNAILQAERIAA